MGQVLTRRLGRAAMLGVMFLVLGACATRSISDSGYRTDRGGGANPFYHGELTEFDVLGIDLQRPVSEEEIATELAKRQKVRLPKGGSLMLVQSGAQIPDDQMVKELDRYFTVVPFNGVPVTSIHANGQNAGYAAMLRLAAAKSGSDVILCYWGIIETAVDREPGKMISWVPLVGATVPDETQLMRIRIKVAVIDVRSGRWSMFSPEAPVDATLSTALARAASDQRQVAALKEKVYKAAVEAFVARYAS